MPLFILVSEKTQKIVLEVTRGGKYGIIICIKLLYSRKIAWLFVINFIFSLFYRISMQVHFV